MREWEDKGKEREGRKWMKRRESGRGDELKEWENRGEEGRREEVDEKKREWKRRRLRSLAGRHSTERYFHSPLL